MFSSDQIRAITEQTKAYPYKLWGFGEGIALEAVWQAGEVLGEPAYKHWVIAMFNRWHEQEPQLREEDHSAPGSVLLDVYRFTHETHYLTRALDLAARMKKLPADASGALFHRPIHPDYHHFIYVDCMEVDAPFFCHLAHVTDDGHYFDVGLQQILGYCHLLQDPTTGFFWHQFDGETRSVNGVFWGRGNGWAMLGMLKTLLLLPIDRPGYNELLGRFRHLVSAIARSQLESGEWPTVLNDPTTYVEGSLSAMFAYALDRALSHGLLDNRYETVVKRAYDALAVRLAENGVLRGVSIATPPGTTAAHYDGIKIGEGFPWGQGPALLAALQRISP